MTPREAELPRALDGAHERIFEMVREMGRRDELIVDLEQRVKVLEASLWAALSEIMGLPGERLDEAPLIAERAIAAAQLRE